MVDLDGWYGARVTPKTFSATWSAASWSEDLTRWQVFLAEHGVAWKAGPGDHGAVATQARSGSPRAGTNIEMRLSVLANTALSKAGDERRLYKRVSSTGEREWCVLSPREKGELAKAGQRFESANAELLRRLATIPVMIGVFLGTKYACEAAGLGTNVAWIAALVVWTLTVRVVRGRWPLQQG